MFYLWHILLNSANWLTNTILVLMLVDCLILNRAYRGSKWWWLLVIVIGNWVGALIYFFFGPSFLFQVLQPLWKKRNNWFPSSQATQPAPPIKQPEPIYTEYQRGYQGEPVETPEPATPGVEETSRYEQPQASYPEFPTQQQ